MTELVFPRSHVQRRGARTDTREQLLRAGLNAVLESGWNATGVEKVLQSVGVPKGSFYHYFRSKDEFGYALLGSYQDLFLKRLHRCFGERTRGGSRLLTHQLAAFLSESTVGMRRFQWRRGCLVGSLGQEVGALHDGFRKRLEACVQEWEQVVAGAILRAQGSGEVHAKADPARLARAFWAAWEGAVLRARLSRSAESLVLVIEDFDHLTHS